MRSRTRNQKRLRRDESVYIIHARAIRTRPSRRSPQSPQAKFLGGGTNLIDLMKMGVETPPQLIDINRIQLAQVEELPDKRSSHRRARAQFRCGGASADQAALSGLERSVPRRSQSAIAQHGDSRRQSHAAHALLLFLRSGVSGVQQTQAGKRLRRARGLQSHSRDSGTERAMHRDQSE